VGVQRIVQGALRRVRVAQLMKAAVIIHSQGLEKKI
jgi:hypothetical protein